MSVTKNVFEKIKEIKLKFEKLNEEVKNAENRRNKIKSN